MIDDRYFLEFADFKRDQADLRLIRTHVFVVEQAVPEDLEWDDDDERCDHVLARDRSNAPIATGRVSPEGKIGRMAVLAAWRGQGVGAAVLRSLIERARERGLSEVHLHAQTHAKKFYLDAGFRPFGAEFDEAGIAHVAMTRVIAAPESLKSPKSVVSARKTEPLLAQSASELIHLSVLVIANARRELCIYSRDLDKAVFNQAATLEALKQFALQYRPRNRLRVLVQDPTDAVKSGHRLIALMQRLPSIISIRVPQDDDLNYASAFIVSETSAYLFRESAERFNARGDLEDGVEAARLRRYFEQVWDRASEHPDLRRLGI